jgi:hypothetical protein
MENPMRRTFRSLALVGLLASLLTGVGATAAGAATEPYCGITWGSLPRTAGMLSQAPLVETRTGQDTCWDRVVFEFNGPVTGYDVRYREVYTEAQGLPMNPYTAGGAVLGVQLYAPAYQEYQATYPGRPGDHVARVVGYQTLRDMMYGGSFEGYTTFAVGDGRSFRSGCSSSPGPVRTAGSCSTSCTAGSSSASRVSRRHWIGWLRRR